MGTWTTTPRTWVAGEVPTATHFNENVRDFGRAFSDAWTSYTPTLTASTTNPTNWTQTGYYMQAGKLVIAKFKLTAGASMTAGSGTYYIALPATANTNIDYIEMGHASLFDSSAALISKFPVQLDNVNGARCRIEYSATYPTGAITTVTNAAPWTWAANDVIRGLIIYEAA